MDLYTTTFRMPKTRRGSMQEAWNHRVARHIMLSDEKIAEIAMREQWERQPKYERTPMIETVRNTRKKINEVNNVGY